MKKGVMILSILFLMLAIFPIVIADEESQIDLAYSCLNNRINLSTCVGTSMSFEQKTFSLLATGQCYNEVALENSSEECWPRGNCNVKSTAQALLSLYNYNNSYNTTKGENWLLSQNTIPQGMDWLLEIESNEATSCTIYYDGNIQGTPITIGTDKKISSSNLGSCFTLSEGGYFLSISPSCYNLDIDVSCDKSFLTNLLFRKQNSNTINVVDQPKESSANGLTTERVDSKCFSNPNSNVCDFEGSLWASEVLFFLNRDTSSFLPYIVAFYEDNPEYVPESFLYYLTGKFKTELLSGQVRNSYWIKSGDEYYDTALALLPLQYESLTEKTNSKNWLLEQQEQNGCWDNGNIRNTAFILFSIWPREISIPGEPSQNQSGICGNGIIEGNEECDGTNLTLTECSDVKGSGWNGSVTCYPENHLYECQYNTTSCVGDVPPECDSDNPCQTGLECVSGSCLTPSNPNTPECEIDDDCNPDEECVNNFCVEETLDCVAEGYSCMSAIDCSSGNLLGEYSCNPPFKCCAEEKTYGTCSSNNGKICNPSETCDGSTVSADNLLSGEICCVGTCEEDIGGNNGDEALCEDNGGRCRSSCLGDERETSFYECSFSDKCCVEDNKTGKNKWLIWVLIALILITIIAIVFREKIKEIMMRIKTKMKKNKSSGPGLRPLFPSGRLPHSPSPSQGKSMPPRRIIPPQHHQQSQTPSKPIQKKKKTPSKELEETLKRLRELGNR
jgi:hypothetical protein